MTGENKAFAWIVLCGMVVTFGIGYHHGASSERAWPTPPPGVEVCELPLPAYEPAGVR